MGKLRHKADTEPQFPYTISPGTLRKLLKAIPSRPKPGKLTVDRLKTWGVTASNDASPIRVLKDLGFLGSSGETLPPYEQFMQPAPVGPRALGRLLREKYKSLFESTHNPQKDENALKTFFNIHAGGSASAINLQLQTFKALAEHADLSEAATAAIPNGAPNTNSTSSESGADGAVRLPPVNIDLHIHLPENKTTRDYEAIIQDIAKYIYGRTEPERG